MFPNSKITQHLQSMGLMTTCPGTKMYTMAAHWFEFFSHVCLQCLLHKPWIWSPNYRNNIAFNKDLKMDSIFFNFAPDLWPYRILVNEVSQTILKLLHVRLCGFRDIGSVSGSSLMAQQNFPSVWGTDGAVGLSHLSQCSEGHMSLALVAPDQGQEGKWLVPLRGECQSRKGQCVDPDCFSWGKRAGVFSVWMLTAGRRQEEERLWVNADLSIWQGTPGIQYPTDLLCVLFIQVSHAQLIANLMLAGVKRQ